MTSPLEKKLKIAGPVLITANRLDDGAVIYRTAHGDWTTDFDTLFNKTGNRRISICVCSKNKRTTMDPHQNRQLRRYHQVWRSDVQVEAFEFVLYLIWRRSDKIEDGVPEKRFNPN